MISYFEQNIFGTTSKTFFLRRTRAHACFAFLNLHVANRASPPLQRRFRSLGATITLPSGTGTVFFANRTIFDAHRRQDDRLFTQGLKEVMRMEEDEEDEIGTKPQRPMLPEEEKTIERLLKPGVRIPDVLQVNCRTSDAKKIDWIDITSHPAAKTSSLEWGKQLRVLLRDLGVPVDDVSLPSSYLLLPHASVVDGCHTLFLRYATRTPPPVGQHSIQNLTNRLAIYVLRTEISSPQASLRGNSSNASASHSQARVHAESVNATAPVSTPASRTTFITVHRCTCHCVDELMDNWEKHMTSPSVLGELLYFFIKRVLGSYTNKLWRCLIDFDGYETGLFREDIDREDMTRRIYDIKRRVAVFERCLSLTQDAYAHMIAALPLYFKDRRYYEMQHRLANAEGLAKDLSSDAESALQLIFQLSSYEVNELMRFLTLFSAFFIPLNFISSVYGMNISGLPFTEGPNGSMYLSGLFCAGIVILLSWFRRKKFL